MSPKTEREQPEQPRPAEPPKTEAKKRFRIEKVEERIAPKKEHGNSSASSGFSSGVSIY